jgi:acetoacetyl-CoA reductase
VAQIPVGRLGSTDEVAAVVSFLASEKTSFITGANISINGGQHVY